MKNVFILAMLTLTTAVSLASGGSGDIGTATCNGTKEMTDTFGPIEIELSEGERSDFAVTITMSENVFVRKGPCNFSKRLTGVRGVMNLVCSDDDGNTLPIRYDFLNGTLRAEFQAPGFGSIPIETICKK